MAMKMKMYFSKSMMIDALTVLLVVMFGTSTWVSLGGLWVELPLLTNLGIPEGYRIGSFFIMVTQAAVIGPLIFITCQLFAPKHYHLEIPAIYLTLAVGAIASFLLIFFWDFHSMWSLDGSEHSTALLALVFFMALVDSTSNVTFLPFISSLKSKYLNWYFIGEGLSSVIPSFVVLIQGSGGDDECVANYTFINTTEDPVNNITLFENCTAWTVQNNEHALFPPQLYYTFIFVLFILSASSFCLLRCLPIFKEQYEKHDDDEYIISSDETNNNLCFRCFGRCKRRKNNSEKIALLTYKTNDRQIDEPQDTVTSICNNVKHTEYLELDSQEHVTDLSRDIEDINLSTTESVQRNAQDVRQREDGVRTDENNIRQKKEDCNSSNNTTEQNEMSENSSPSPKYCTTRFSGRHIFLFITLTINSALIYGALPSIQSFSAGSYGSHTYLLVTSFAEISVPFGFLLVMVRPTTSYLVVLVSALGGLTAGTYCMVVAILSPQPPLQGRPWGQILIVLAWILQGLFFSYCRATIGGILRNDNGSRFSMMCFGGCTTIGTLIGAIIMFPLVNIYDVFEGPHLTEGCVDQITCVVTESNIVG